MTSLFPVVFTGEMLDPFLPIPKAFKKPGTIIDADASAELRIKSLLSIIQIN